VIRPALRTVPGVADVNALGGMVESFEVAPDSNALAAAGLSVADLAAAINAGNRNDGAGRRHGRGSADRALHRRHPHLDDLGAVVIRSAPQAWCGWAMWRGCASARSPAMAW
jgi:cobalt-zinc-cadmium resistance protein CzcA